MPSPIAHSIAGYAIGRSRLGAGLSPAFAGRLGLLRFWGLVGFLSLLPDMDAVVGVAAGDLGRFHNQFSHSIVVGLAAAVLAALVAFAFDRARARAWFLLTLACYWVHVIMDYFTVGRGVMAFWPLAERRFQSPVKLFYGLCWAESLASPSHLVTLVNELAFAGIVLGIMRLARRQGTGGRRQ